MSRVGVVVCIVVQPQCIAPTATPTPADTHAPTPSHNPTPTAPAGSVLADSPGAFGPRRQWRPLQARGQEPTQSSDLVVATRGATRGGGIGRRRRRRRCWRGLSRLCCRRADNAGRTKWLRRGRRGARCGGACTGARHSTGHSTVLGNNATGLGGTMACGDGLERPNEPSESHNATAVVNAGSGRSIADGADVAVIVAGLPLCAPATISTEGGRRGWGREWQWLFHAIAVAAARVSPCSRQHRHSPRDIAVARSSSAE